MITKFLKFGWSSIIVIGFIAFVGALATSAQALPQLSHSPTYNWKSTGTSNCNRRAARRAAWIRWKTGIPTNLISNLRMREGSGAFKRCTKWQEASLPHYHFYPNMHKVQPARIADFVVHQTRWYSITALHTGLHIAHFTLLVTIGGLAGALFSAALRACFPWLLGFSSFVWTSLQTGRPLSLIHI